MPRPATESNTNFLLFTAIVCVCLGYAGYAVGMARALSGHLKLALPGLLLPTLLAIVYSVAGVLLGAGLIVGAMLGSHWGYILGGGLLGPWWVQHPKSQKAMRGATSVLGYVLGPVFGAAGALLWGIFFFGLFAVSSALSVGVSVFGWISGVRRVVGRLVSIASSSAEQTAAVPPACGVMHSEATPVEQLQERFDRNNYQEV